MSSAEIDAGLTALARDALSHYGLSAQSQVTLIGHRENAVFRIESSDRHGRAALRIHRPGYQTVASICSELDWTHALTEVGVPCPAAIPTLDGQRVLTLQGDIGLGERNMVLLEWVGGAPLEGDDQLSLFQQLGILCSRIHVHSRGWKKPPTFTRQRWDAEGMFGDTTHWGRYQDLSVLSPDHVALLDRARLVAHQQLADHPQTPDCFGLIHADLLPENILVEDGHMHVIDFDDCGHGWFVHDLATALFYHQGTPEFDTLRDAWLTGYRSVAALAGEETARLDLFMFGRGLANLGWRHTRGLGQSSSSSMDWLIETTCTLAKRIIAKYGSGQ